MNLEYRVKGNKLSTLKRTIQLELPIKKKTVIKKQDHKTITKKYNRINATNYLNATPRLKIIHLVTNYD